MTLDQELTEFRTEAERTAPAVRLALYRDAADELRKRFPIDRARAVGDIAPDFTLPNVHGRPISLSKVLGGGPAVVTFYRGGWCPYCNIQLRAYQRALPQIAATGGRLLAISPQLPDASLTTVQKNELEFEVLSDARNEIARAFGLVYVLAEGSREAMRSNNKALPGINGDDSWELPIPATYVIAPGRRIVLAFLDTDHRKRLEPEAIIESLRSVR